LTVLLFLAPAVVKSRSPADGREETGEGRILDGAVPGDIEVDKVAFFGNIVEGSEGVEACRGNSS
jgi:hypothetical protein